MTALYAVSFTLAPEKNPRRDLVPFQSSVNTVVLLTARADQQLYFPLL